MQLKYSVYNWDVPALDLEDDDLAYSHWLVLVVCEEKQITSVKRWFHATTVKER